jgi:hypothetical protein
LRYNKDMTEVLHANIFFIIASVGTVLFILFVTLILWHILKVVIRIRRIIERIDEASDQIVHDVREFRASVKQGFIGNIINWFLHKK